MIVNEIAQTLAAGYSRLAVFIRHGEKNSVGIGPVLITQQAIKASKALGDRLSDFKTPIKLYSSPELRCIQTAKILSQQIFGIDGDVTVTTFLGLPGIQVKNNNSYLEVFNEYGARGMYAEWKNGKNHNALRTVDELCTELSNFLERTAMESTISIFVSQSGTVAALGYAVGLRDYDIENNEWVPFLDGFVLALK